MVESKQQTISKNNPDDQSNYECHSGQIWVKTLDESELLFKFYDTSVKEEKEPKKIKDEQIFPKTSQT